MKTARNYPRTFITLLLPVTMSGLVLTWACSSSESAPKTTAQRGKANTQPANSKRPAAKNASSMRLKRHTFPDVTMGVPAAYAVLLPVGWTAKGQVQWQLVGEALFPQQKFEINSPQKGRITYEPLMTFNYMESQGMGAQGIPAPANFPQWLVQAAPQADPSISDVKLVKSTRDTRTEEFLKKIEAATGGSNGMEREAYIIVLDYNEGGIRRREEMHLTYVRFQPYVSAGMSSQMWSIGHSGSFSAPASQFSAQRNTLVNVANTLRATPEWHTQSQAAIAEMSRQRVANGWERIKARGRQINQMSDADYSKYKKDTTNSDAAQRGRINSIYETDDFKDTNGNIVNLPTHYQHIFSDGKGNYVLSNNSQDRPGSTWTSIRPYK